ncbi:3'-5' exonuclease [Herbiconiux liangxiaofengii]|uniref:3'-5' exonuclease n=1 Tax=Herbiconiux liangxiaofengii TaxID=3342795 RepID=UPI0035BB972F
MSTGFATIDFETTGLVPGDDRAIEIAVVHSDVDGTVTGSWDTLIDPGRGPGPTRIHRITAEHLEGAPTFADIAPELLGLLSGRVVVAHNIAFDQRFLLAELARIGYRPRHPLVTLCTMQLARHYLPGLRRGLASCCDVLGIDLTGAHRASVDARATAALLAAYQSHTVDRSGWRAIADAAAAQPLPALPSRGTAWYPRERAAGAAALQFA